MVIVSDFDLDKGEGFFGLRPSVGALRHQFTMPPFSVWNTCDGEWQRRRRLWITRGIKSELGRDVTPVILPEDNGQYKGVIGRFNERTSIFDPVVCELCYGWWCPPGGVVLDPFAGGSVRGIVASLMGRKYYGIELRSAQVEANQAQINQHTRGQYAPKWRCGDSLKLTPDAPRCDFIFTCPPYGNLEAYSDDPNDISNMPYEKFLKRYRQIISNSINRLRDNRFACFVVGNYRSRDKDGRQMIDLVGDTIRAFESAGVSFYNDIVLINQVGSGAMRTNTTFKRGARKVVKIHQNVLVFVKGCPKKAAAACPLNTK